MEYAINLLIPIGLGLMLGQWLEKTYQADPIWTVLLSVLGMMAGLGISIKRYYTATSAQKASHLLQPKGHTALESTDYEAHRKTLKAIIQKPEDDDEDADLPAEAWTESLEEELETLTLPSQQASQSVSLNRPEHNGELN